MSQERRENLWAAIGALVAIVLFTGQILFWGAAETYAAGAITDVVNPVTQGDWTSIEWNYEAAADGTATAETSTRVYGEFVTVYHEPDISLPTANTFSLSAKPGFGYGRGWYQTDLLSGRNVGPTVPGTATNTVYPLWPNTPSIPVSSKLAFRVTNMLTGTGEPAKGRFVAVIGPK